MSKINSAIFLSKLKGLASEEALEFLSQLLRLFPTEVQTHVTTALEALPSTGDNIQKVLEIVKGQWEGIQSKKLLNIAILGASQTGKTTLLRTIEKIQSPASPKIFNLIESHGLEEFLGYKSTRQLPNKIDQADLVLLLLDSQYEVSKQTFHLFKKVKSLGKPLIIGLNKADLVSNPTEMAKKTKKILRERTVVLSVYNKMSLQSLFQAIVASHRNALYPLTTGFPRFRKTICRGIVTQAAIGCSLVRVIPIPISNLLPIAAIQTSMVLKISRAYGYQIDQKRSRELIPTLLSGSLIQKASNHFSREFPKQEKLISSSLSGIGTYLLGQGAIHYFERFSSFLEENKFPKSVPLAG